MKNWILTAALALTLGAVGCNNGGGDSASGSSVATVTTANGVVGQLTGDADDDVSPQLQDLVEDALARGDSDEPLDGF